jgi:hypothetical protein
LSRGRPEETGGRKRQVKKNRGQGKGLFFPFYLTAEARVYIIYKAVGDTRAGGRKNNKKKLLPNPGNLYLYN